MFKIMVFSMSLNKSHPKIPRNLKWIGQFTIMHGIFFFTYCLLIYSTIFHDLKNNDISQACANGILSVIFNVVSLQYAVMVWHQSKFHDMIEIMKFDYKLAQTLPKEEYDIVLCYAKKSRTIVYLWLKIVICVASLFPIKSFTLMLYYHVIGEFRYVPLYDITYPEPVELNKNNLAVFLALYVLFLFYDIYAMFMYLAFSPLGPILILHVCGQLELLRNRILKTFSKSNNTAASIGTLKRIAIHFIEIYGFAARINSSLRVFHELLFKAGAIILPITFYQIIETAKRGQVSVEFISIIFGAVAICSVPCYYSDVLMEKSEDVRRAIYSCGWESNWDPVTRSLLFLLLTRASRPVAMRTLYRNICLNVLTDIYHQAYAIFNLLNAVWH
ncbi:odorant receptor 56a-like [Zerene cesonia]|uniref:odorant receptor 56a-like n=1 Tax=Zerene cesonia TaxID=33412 RepID=UPI0018E562E7|nr:odorant receptor 56a-like [Zerene cesonia]